MSSCLVWNKRKLDEAGTMRNDLPCVCVCVWPDTRWLPLPTVAATLINSLSFLTRVVPLLSDHQISDTPWASGLHSIIPLCLLTLFCCYTLTPCDCVCVSPDLDWALVPVPVSCWLSCAPPLLLSLVEPDGSEPELLPQSGLHPVSP